MTPPMPKMDRVVRQPEQLRHSIAHALRMSHANERRYNDGPAIKFDKIVEKSKNNLRTASRSRIQIQIRRNGTLDLVRASCHGLSRDMYLRPCSPTTTILRAHWLGYTIRALKRSHYSVVSRLTSFFFFFSIACAIARISSDFSCVAANENEFHRTRAHKSRHV